MAERNKRLKGIILAVKELGENNRLVTFLSQDDGVMSAVLYGGPKSKLKSLVQPFNSGTLFIYSDESRHSTKITDFDAASCHLSFRSNLYKAFAASLAAEIVMKTKCAGDSSSAFVLLSALLDGMEACDENGARLGMLRFLWRYMGLLGVQPDVRQCVSCGSSLLQKSRDSAFAERHSGFVCCDCIPYYSDADKSFNSFGGKLDMDIHGLTYLAAINELKPREVRELLLPAESAYKMKRFLYHLIERNCDTKLETLHTAAGIL